MHRISDSRFSSIRGLRTAALSGLAAVALSTSVVLAQGPTAASAINPYLVLDQSRAELAHRFPALSSHELDRLTFRAADIRSMRDKGDTSPAGDWFCLTGDKQPIRLMMRATSYVINRSGQAAMGGEYTHTGHDLTISNGPLKGMGFAGGRFVAASPRSLTFQSENVLVLHCDEVL
jgi:hypothetical protein